MNGIVFFLAAATLANASRFSLVQPHIMGGFPTLIDSYPYQVSVRAFAKYNCGGAMITTRHIVTAADCVYLKDYPDRFDIRAGSNKLKKEGVTRRFITIAWHPNYTQERLDWNIAVGTLKEKLAMSRTIKPISLVRKSGEPTAGERLTITGWGAKKAKKLYAAQIRAVGRTKCKTMYAPTNITENMICAGAKDLGIDQKHDELVVYRLDTTNCTRVVMADYGAPLVNSDKLLVGIASFSKKSDPSGYPAVYVNFASPAIHTFIVSTVKADREKRSKEGQL